MKGTVEDWATECLLAAKQAYQVPETGSSAERGATNIILTRRGGLFDFVKVVDFGLVKAVDVGTVSALTTVDSIVGTPLYMAPEAIRQPEQADVRTDLYAVTAVGYLCRATGF